VDSVALEMQQGNDSSAAKRSLIGKVGIRDFSTPAAISLQSLQ
jgi:hypothetical protein